jgi:hypothetical protein
VTRPAAEDARLDDNHAEFRSLLAEARRRLRRGRPAAAAAYAQAAAAFAWTNHTGLFASDELEGLLADVGSGVPDRTIAGSRVSGPRGHGPRSILHVLTQAYDTGGHTQAVACWMEQDAGRTHRVCLTRQGAAPVPRKIVDRLRSRSDLVRLDARHADLTSRAAALRALARRHDLVLLHLHPYDVVPSMAFAPARGLPPIAFVDHSDHTFWTGAGGSGLLVSMRESGLGVATGRRGIDPDRCHVLSRPLRLQGRTRDRATAKSRLGIEPGDVLFVTAADPSKFRPVTPPALLDLLVPFFARHPRARLLAAGPEPAQEWADAERRTGGRIRALGRVPDVMPLHEAADVYLDSFPFSSLTSLLESGSVGNPTVTYRGHPPGCAVLGADTPGVDHHIQGPADPAELHAVLEELLIDADRRTELGDGTCRAIVAGHTGDGWRNATSRMYAAAADASGPLAVGPPVRDTAMLDVLVRAVLERTGHARGVAGALRDTMGLLPLRERAAVARTLPGARLLPAPRTIVSESARARLGRWRRVALAAPGRTP